jgi:hypothetical protein
VIRKGNELQLEGQPLINATFYAPAKPTVLKVNGKNANIDFERNQLTVKLDNRK